MKDHVEELANVYQYNLNLPPESDGAITALTFRFPASLIIFFFQKFDLIVLQWLFYLKQIQMKTRMLIAILITLCLWRETSTAQMMVIRRPRRVVFVKPAPIVSAVPVRPRGRVIVYQ